MNRRRARSSGSRVAIGVLIIFGILFLARRQATTPDADEDAIAGGLDDALTSPGTVPERDGLAAAILIDVSGSMNETVAGQRKIVSARAAAITLVEQFARYADDHKGEPVQLGIFEFSDRDNAPDCRVVVPMGPPVT